MQILNCSDIKGYHENIQHAMNRIKNSSVAIDNVSVNSIKVSVALMSYKRTANVIKIVNTMVKYKNVGEILIQNFDATLLTYDSKIITLGTEFLFQKYGLIARFYSCLYSKYDWCLIIDDDILISEIGIQKLIEHKLSEPNRLYGFHGRNYDDKNPIYRIKVTYDVGEVSIILTHVVLTDKR